MFKNNLLGKLLNFIDLLTNTITSPPVILKIALFALIFETNVKIPFKVKFCAKMTTLPFDLRFLSFSSQYIN